MPATGFAIKEVRLERVVGREEQEDLCLERVGILKLIDEYVCKSMLEFAANNLVVANEIAREEQQIQKVELTRARFQSVVRCNEWTEVFCANTPPRSASAFTSNSSSRSSFAACRCASAVSRGESFLANHCPLPFHPHHLGFG